MQIRLQRLNKRIAVACEKAKRDPQTVKILAVSKAHSTAEIESACRNGLRDFGENYAQEMSSKIEDQTLKNLGLNWHYIGRIQGNKLRQIADASCVHTLGEFKHANMLSEILGGKKIQAFLQVNLGGEGQRSGVLPESVVTNYRAIKTLSNINLCGLMTVAPIETAHGPRHWFEKMWLIKNDLEHKIGEAVPELSMGMSSDFEEAILFGATWIRIGTLIFGNRTPTND